MPIINVNFDQLFSQLGLDAEHKKIQYASIKMMFTSTGLKFSKGKKVLANAPFSAAKAADVVAGKISLPDPTAQTIKSTLATSVLTALSADANPAEAQSSASSAHSSAIGASSEEAVPSGYPDMFNGNLETAKPVPLKEATMLLQPVLSTSPGSRYFVVGLSPSLKVAIRVKPSKLSIRVEGHQLSSFKYQLENTGMFGKIEGSPDYVSAHLSVHSRIEVLRIVGALVATLPAIVHPVPDVKIAQKLCPDTMTYHKEAA